MNTLPQYKSLIFEIKEKTAYIYINRPDQGNAICGKIIDELYDAFQTISLNTDIRCVVISSKGEYFCLGPDMEWLQRSVSITRKESVEESLTVGKLMFMIYTFSKPVICVVNGYAAGCGVGLLSVCDIVISSEEATLVFDEVKYGFTPSLYAPYVIKKIGESKARELFITGMPFSAAEAKTFGLVNYVVPKDKIEEKTNQLIKELLSGAPGAISMIKDVLSHVRIMRYDEVLKYTSECVADLSLNDELKEGVLSKIEKRKPNWLA